MEMDQSTPPDDESLSLWQRVYASYIEGLKYITKFFRKRKMDLTGDAIVSLLAEPVSIVKVSHYTYIGNVDTDDFHHFDLNPLYISYYESSEVVTLLIHGAGGNHGVWLPFARKFKEEEIGPVFTMNMPKVGSAFHYKREVQEIEKEAVRSRMNEIKQLYLDQGKSPPEFVIIGFSRGGDSGLAVCDEESDIKKVIRLGKVTPSEDLDTTCVKKLIEIEARFDAICHWRSQLPLESRYSAMTGHIGLLFSEDVQNKIVSIIKDTT